jgi:uncharacterized membrane protein (DUF2068 family)
MESSLLATLGFGASRQGVFMPASMTDSSQNTLTPSSPPRKKGAPTLYVIGGFKVLKGLLFVIVAITAYNLSDNDLPSDFQNLLHVLRFNPERKFWSDLAVKVGNLTEREVVQFAVGSLIYSFFSLFEGVGLLYRIKWIGYLAIGESAFFIPIEVHHLVNKYSRSVLVILIINVCIVWYLYRNRERLFSHH